MGVSDDMSEILDKQHWVNVPKQLRQRYIANELDVLHPPLTRILKQLFRSAAACKNKGAGDAALIIGGSGSGKSHLIDMVFRHKTADHTGDISKVPIVRFSVPSAPTQRAMSSQLLLALEHPKSRYGNAQDMFNRAITQIRAVQTEIIMIDNVHDIPERRRAGGVMQIGNWIRDLIDESHCLVALFGTQAARQVTEANAQLRRRVPTHMHIDYFGIEVQRDIAIFRRFLHELDKRLPLVEISGLSDSDLMVKLYWATGGIADYIFRFVSEAVDIAVERGREKLLLEDFEAAFNLIFQDAARDINPFSSDGPQRLLDQTGEPFHNWFDNSNPRPEKHQVQKASVAR